MKHRGVKWLGAYLYQANLPSLGPATSPSFHRRIGKGDFIYVRYIDNRHIRLGPDIGEPNEGSELIEIRPDPLRRSPSKCLFYPPRTLRNGKTSRRAEQTARDRDSRQVNGKTRARVRVHRLDANKDDVYLGQNPLADTVVRRFHGNHSHSETHGSRRNEKRDRSQEIRARARSQETENIGVSETYAAVAHRCRTQRSQSSQRIGIRRFESVVASFATVACGNFDSGGFFARRTLRLATWLER